MNVYNLTDRLPVYGVEDDCILSRQGDFTIAYRLLKPEIFTMSGKDYTSLHQAIVRGIRLLPSGAILHLMDWYTRQSYQPAPDDVRSWLSQASERFFNERPWINHESYLFLTMTPPGRAASSSALTTLLKPHLFQAETLQTETRALFLGACGQFCQVLEDCGLLRLERMKKEELWSHRKRAGLIERYCHLGPNETPVLLDIDLQQGLRIGDKFTQLFSIAEADDLPSHCGPRMDYEKYSTDRTRFSIGFASPLGPLLPYDHIYSQFVFIGDAAAALSKQEARRLRLQSLSAYSRENAASEAATNAYLQEAVTEQRMPVRAHFHVLAWTSDRSELPAMKNSISSALSQLEVTPRQETAGAAALWWAGMPGNEGDFPMNDTFLTFGEQAASFFQMETNYHTSLSPYGLRLGDRLTGRPLQVDIDITPRATGLIANSNTLIISGSGGGKSFFTNHMVRSEYEQGTHVLIIDIGHSYQVQCELHKGYYFTYEEDNPIRFNPFYLGEGELFDTEKKESIKTLLLALWKKSDESHNRSEYVALSIALKLYFEKIGSNKDIFPCFDSFYEFLRDDFVLVLETDRVSERDFNMSNFLYVLKQYYRGGEFDYLLNATGNMDLLNERFIVFELDKIRDNPVLLPVTCLIVMELFVSKMRKLKGVRKMIVIEEAWKAIAREGMAEYIKYLCKTVRKFMARTVIVTQDMEDMISSEIIKYAIINNSDIKILLDQSKFLNKFDLIQEVLGITDKQKAEILSLNRGHEPGRQYKDVWIGLGPQHSRVYRLEVSPEEYYVYTSDQKEKALVRASINKYKDVKKGIAALVAETKKL